MFDRAKIAYRLADFIRRASKKDAGANTRKHVLEVVCTLQGNLGDWHDFAHAGRIAKDNSSVFEVGARFKFDLSAKPNNPAMRSIC